MRLERWLARAGAYGVMRARTHSWANHLGKSAVVWTGGGGRAEAALCDRTCARPLDADVGQALGTEFTYAQPKDRIP